MNRKSTAWDTLLITSMVLLAGICAQAQAQQAKEGKVVQIGPDVEGAELDVVVLPEDQDAVENAASVQPTVEPSYWIGIRGRSIESAVLRTHLQLAEDMGVVVEEVVPNSPASKAGLRRHDIILRANGDAVDNMKVLQSQVLAGKDKPLEMRIIRLGKQEKLVVVPEVRPESVEGPPRNREFGLEVDPMQQLLERFGARNIGPGMIFRGGPQAFNFNQMPNGVSVSIQRNNEGPAQITVKKDGQTWQIEGDDEESLTQLPDDVRPFVRRMLNNQNGVQAFGGQFDMGDFNAQMEQFLPRGLGDFGIRGEALQRRFNLQEDEMRKRMERLENRLKQLQNRFENEDLDVPRDNET